MTALLGIEVNLKTVRVVNHQEKPGPVFIEIARSAYEMGVEYFFRVKDDTEILQPWTSAFIKSLELRG